MATYSERLRSNTPAVAKDKSTISHGETSSNTGELQENPDHDKADNFWQSYGAMKNVFKKFKDTTVNRVNRRAIPRTAVDYIRNNRLITAAVVTSILIALIAVFISSPYACNIYYRSFKGANPPPGNWLASGNLKIPFYGDHLSFLNSPFKFLDKLSKKYGPIAFTRLYGDPVVVLSGFDALKVFNEERVVVNHFSFPPTIPSPDSKSAAVEKMILHATTEDALEKYVPIVSKIIQKYVERWAEKKKFGLLDETYLLSTEIGLSVFLGRYYEGAHIPKDISNSILLITKAASALHINLPLSSYWLSNKATIRLLQYTEVNILESILVPSTYPSFISVVKDQGLLQKDSLDEFTIALEVALLSQTAVVGVAFSDAAMALHYHPNVYEKIREEMKSFSIDRHSDVSISQLRRMKYLSAVVYEILRYYPLVAYEVARTTSDMTILGYDIPANMTILGNIFTTLHDPKYWSSPEEFNPDRFYKNHEPYKGMDPSEWPMQFHPNSMGEFVKFQLELFLLHLVRNHASWELPSKTYDLNWNSFVPFYSDNVKVSNFNKGVDV